MSISRLDNEFHSFKRGEAIFEKEPNARGRLEVRSSIPLKDKLDPAMLQSRLDRIAEFEFDPGHLDYLKLQGVGEPYLEHLRKEPMPPAVVRARADQIAVRVDGPITDLPLWEVPIANQLHELYFAQIITTSNLFLDGVRTEAGRRLQVKLDIMRGGGITFVENGTRQRYDWNWYGFLTTALVGDVPHMFVGTTNPHTALAHGINLVDTLGSGYRRSVSPTLEELENRSKLDGPPILVAGLTAYQMAHANAHVPGLFYEWGDDLTCDMGPGGQPLPLSFEVIR